MSPQRRPSGQRHIPAAYPKLATPDGQVVLDKIATQQKLPERKAVVQHATPGAHAPLKGLKGVPGLNRGPYVTWSWETPLVEQIEHVLGHLDGLPCPGCKDATALLVQFRERVQHESTAEFEERLAQITENNDADNRGRAVEADEGRGIRASAEDKPFT